MRQIRVGGLSGVGMRQIQGCGVIRCGYETNTGLGGYQVWV